MILPSSFCCLNSLQIIGCWRIFWMPGPPGRITASKGSLTTSSRWWLACNVIPLLPVTSSLSASAACTTLISARFRRSIGVTASISSTHHEEAGSLLWKVRRAGQVSEHAPRFHWIRYGNNWSAKHRQPQTDPPGETEAFNLRILRTCKFP